jgi:basic amino acid/polyamine antiporter, APA family
MPASAAPQAIDSAGPAPGNSLPRVIGVGALAASAINTIVGSGIFGLPGLAAAMLGPAAVLAYVVCAILIGLVGLCLAEVGSRVANAGGLYAYATAAFGPVVGGVAGTLLWASNSVIAGAAVATLLADTLALAAPSLAGGFSRIAFFVTVYALLAAVNITGARAGARLSTVMAGVKLAPLLLLVAAGIPAIQAANLQWPAMPGPDAIGRTAVLLFFAFMGIEGGLNASGEVVAPARTVPRAIGLALTFTATLYVALQLTAQGVLGQALPNNAAPLAATAAVVFGPWGSTFLIAATALSVTGYLAADILCSPRTVFAMAERRQLPRVLAHVSPRSKSPAVAIGVYAAACAILACTGSFRQLVIAATSGTLLLYLICCVAVLPLRARGVATHGAPFVAPGGTFVPLAASAIILWMLSTLTSLELASAVGLVIVSAIVYAVREQFAARAALAAEV